VQRLGYVLDQCGKSALAAPLARWLDERRHRRVRLRTGVPGGGAVLDRTWRVVTSERIDAET
jgi:hypothetical protein